ncbi:hypothetical protein B0H11DRAFT_1925641 [Mycena galericulata]|nr:hypothetical protein B0H11DRAFT_1925641 [Mycena galericulata]
MSFRCNALSQTQPGRNSSWTRGRGNPLPLKDLSPELSGARIALSLWTWINNGTPAYLEFTGFLGSQGMDARCVEPATKKRKTADYRALEESEDEGKEMFTGCRSKN